MTYVQDDYLILSGSLIINDKKELLLLYRRDHNHYETPGGKVELADCQDQKNPTINDLETAARRELFEELGKDITIISCEYFAKIEFIIPDGRKAVAHKFLMKITGNPKINEPKTFSELKHIPIHKLGSQPLSPDLQQLLPKIKELTNK